MTVASVSCCSLLRSVLRQAARMPRAVELLAIATASKDIDLTGPRRLSSCFHYPSVWTTRSILFAIHIIFLCI